ncbi:MAG: hypothetical protein NTZ17_01195 [Phycisphaerae bacterium]|nr:hypothetical protein [Phycisphaerae bacterium]
MAMNEKEVEQQCREFRELFEALRREVGKVIVGHEEIVDDVLITLFSGGHVLLEGVGKNTVTRYLRLAGAQGRKLHDELVAFSPSHPSGADG